MKIVLRFGSLFIITTVAFAATALAQNSSHNPTWWDKYTYLAKNGPLGEGGSTSSISFGSNVDLSKRMRTAKRDFYYFKLTRAENARRRL